MLREKTKEILCIDFNTTDSKLREIDRSMGDGLHLRCFRSRNKQDERDVGSRSWHQKCKEVGLTKGSTSIINEEV